MRCSFWSPFSSFDTIFAQTLHMLQSCDHLNSQLAVISHTCLTRTTLSSILLVKGLPLPESSFPSLRSSFNLLCYLKRRVCNILAEAFQMLVMKFSTVVPKISSLFVPGCSLFFLQLSLLNDLKKRRCKQKHEKNIQWLQKANIAVINTQDRRCPWCNCYRRRK